MSNNKADEVPPKPNEAPVAFSPYSAQFQDMLKGLEEDIKKNLAVAEAEKKSTEGIIGHMWSEMSSGVLHIKPSTTVTHVGNGYGKIVIPGHAPSLVSGIFPSHAKVHLDK